jgi:catechol 2,3-dioxygenase-like lactoylglutathione lyase family enzyme
VRTTAIAAVFTLGFAAGLWAASLDQDARPMPAERVSGIGGVFFKAIDPKALSVWYREKLGIGDAQGRGFTLFLWREREDATRVGTTVWSLFPVNTNHFAPSEASFMINYRVRNLEAMLAQLRALGVTVDQKVVEDFNGTFAWIVDPEGNKIELWEPKAGF